MAYEIVVGRDEKDRQEYGLSGTVLLGKHFVTMGRMTSLSNPVFLDVVRSHVVFVCGKRGGGKCLHGDTLITLDNGLRIPIKKLKNNDSFILSADKNLKITSAKKTKFYERKVKVLLKLKLNSGKEIKLTPEHPLLTKKGWIPARSLKVGSNIAAVNENKTEYKVKWEKISKISSLKGNFTVYDITVPKYHNFVANDIIVHNSYTMGVITEGVSDLSPEIKDNIAIVMLDTMGVYWTMKYPNKQDPELLDQWGLKAKPLDIVIYTPTGFYKEYKAKGIPTDRPFAVKPNELNSTDWCITFDIPPNSAIGVLIGRVIAILKEEVKEYSMDDIVEIIKKDTRVDQVTKDAAANMFENANAWGLFDVNGTELRDIIKGGQVTVLDVSCYATSEGGWAVKNLVIGLVAQKLFIERMIARKDEEYQSIHRSVHYFEEEKEDELKKETPMVWLVIDEAHEFLPRDGKTTATDALVTIMREGRQPGISLILATQQP
ncbi:MAG: polymorphic toxin-type HINT domain-containing protein, partial [Nanoarchaeota archaeon]|nr:polymorphic toxin-type HINT domain-containing protein [Nanoarchaeota archaeon]